MFLLLQGDCRPCLLTLVCLYIAYFLMNPEYRMLSNEPSSLSAKHLSINLEKETFSLDTPQFKYLLYIRVTFSSEIHP